MNQLVSAWMEDSTTETTRISIDKKIDRFVEGDLEHATEILSALWEIANDDGDIKAPSNTPSAVSPVWVSYPSRCSTGGLIHAIRPRRSQVPPIGPL
jgi:hypothetical protein